MVFSRNSRLLKAYLQQVRLIREREKSFWPLTDSELIQKTNAFRKNPNPIDAFSMVVAVCRRLQGERWKVCGEDLTWNLIPYDVQLMGALALMEGKIAEMATGEGKTLVAVFPLFYYALQGKGVHLATANDYLALRDSEWMGQVFRLLGLSVGCLQNGMAQAERKVAYGTDITYGTGKEFGFDYLRDHSSAYTVEEMVQCGHYFALVDEADNILIDEARTPLIISGSPIQNSRNYDELRGVVEGLIRDQKKLCEEILSQIEQKSVENFSIPDEGVKLFMVSKGDPAHSRFLKYLQDFRVAKLVRDAEIFLMRDFKRKRIKEILNRHLFYVVDESARNCYLTEMAMEELGQKHGYDFVLPDISSDGSDSSLDLFESKRQRVHILTNLLKAYTLYRKDVDYCVVNGQIYLVDVFTGRLLPGRRLVEGLHQAIEAKEGLEVSPETQTIATISTQNYFHLYEHLAGMTGTAMTSAREFREIYKLEVVRIPTYKPLCRVDERTTFFRTEKEKIDAIVSEAQAMYETARPVLVGTSSVERSEALSRRLRDLDIPHQVLNARRHQEEAGIIAKAGKSGAVTIATNMAGRGTDICLDPEVKTKKNGLHIIGTERHESRRIDDQLRGRAGRLGDPGSSHFFVSMEDHLLKRFGEGKLVKAMKFLTLPVFKPLAQSFLERLVDFVQAAVEHQNFSFREMLLKFDDVVEAQREIIYALREDILRNNSSLDVVTDFLKKVMDEREWVAFKKDFDEKARDCSEVLERLVVVGILDRLWIQHLADLEHLRDGIGFRSVGQANREVEYKRESYRLFSSFVQDVARSIAQNLFKDKELKKSS